MRWALAVVALAIASGGIIYRPARTTASAAINPAHECTFCHGLHGASSDKLLNDIVRETLCLSCHDPAGGIPSAPKADVHQNDRSKQGDIAGCCPADSFRVTCAGPNGCHITHSNVTNWLGGTNLKLVKDSVLSPGLGVMRPVVFERRGSNFDSEALHSFCDNNQDADSSWAAPIGADTVWDGVCDTCHSNPDLNRHHHDGSGQHHQNGATCTRSGCHTHAGTFNP